MAHTPSSLATANDGSSLPACVPSCRRNGADDSLAKPTATQTQIQIQTQTIQTMNSAPCTQTNGTKARPSQQSNWRGIPVPPSGSDRPVPTLSELLSEI